LAADPTALARLSTGQTIIQSPPSALANQPSDATSTAATPSADSPPNAVGSNPSFPHGNDSSPVACHRCQDARVLVTSRGATPCPDCTSDRDDAEPAVCPHCKRPMPTSAEPETPRKGRSSKRK
jgi:hypothetical protein